MKVGDRILHKTRPDLEFGVLLKLTGNETCTADFSGNIFSGILQSSVGTEEEIKNGKFEEKSSIKKSNTVNFSGGTSSSYVSTSSSDVQNSIHSGDWSDNFDNNDSSYWEGHMGGPDE